MSEKNVNLTVASLEVTTTEQANPAIPTWFAEALLLGQYWQHCGLLERLQQQAHVNRGRMGKYEVCDFVLLLLAYAVSGLTSVSRQLHIDDLDHLVSKVAMTRVEGENSRLRHYLARLHRKTFCYSKSKEMLRYSIRLLLHYLKLGTVPIPGSPSY